MSQRVQKGSTVFRPVAKPRARPGSDARQTFAVPDTRASVGPTVGPNGVLAPPRATSTMPPPSFIPKPISADTVSDGSQDTSASTTVYMDENVARSDHSRPPTIQATSRHRQADAAIGSAGFVPSRASPSVPIVIGHSRPAPSLDSAFEHAFPSGGAGQPLPGTSQPLPQRLHSVPASASAQSALPVDVSQIDPSLLPSNSISAAFPRFQNAEPGPSSLPAPGRDLRIALSTDSAVKVPRPRRKASQKLTDNGYQGSDGEHTTENASTSHPKRRRTKISGAPTQENDGAKPRRKRRSRKRDGEESGSEGGSTGKKRQRRSSTVSRRSQTRGPTPPPFDPDAEPGEELDPTVVTMAALCADTGQGRVSSKASQIMSNHAAWRAANREKRARMRATMEAKKYGRNIDDEATANPPAASAATIQDGVEESSSLSVPPAPPVQSTSEVDELGAETVETRDGFDYAQDVSTSRFNVQVRIGPNGETIIDEESLFVNRNEEDDTETYTHVEESDATKFVNSATYSKKARGSRWSAEETELFYDALSQFGENYELISYVLPGRDRKACKNKFKAEDKKDPIRITYCLNNRTPYDIATLSRMTGKDFSGPAPEIRAPTPLRSTGLDINAQTEAQTAESPQVKRKKSRTPSLSGDVEVLGSIDDLEKGDVGDDIFGDEVQG